MTEPQSTTVPNVVYVEEEAPHALSNNLVFLLARASVVALAAANDALSPFGLTVRSYCILVAAANGRHTQRELADVLERSQSLVVSAIDDLERHGYVERAPLPSDRRANAIVATAAGEEVMRTADVALSRVISEASLTRDDLLHLATALAKLARVPEA